MAAMVPVGMDTFGSARSPDMFTPAVNPVTAGKKMPKRVPKPVLGSGWAASSGRAATRASTSGLPRAMANSDRRMRPRIRYWVRIARVVLMNVTAVRATRVSVPQRRIAPAVGGTSR
jgi:hypothetical protein